MQCIGTCALYKIAFPIHNFYDCIYCYSIMRYLNIIHQKDANCGFYRLNVTSDSDSPCKMGLDVTANDMIQ